MLGLAIHFDFHRDVAVGGLDDFVGDAFDFLLHFVKLAAHEALDGINRIAGVGDRLPLGRVANQSLARLAERNYGWRRSFAL